jgi:hypothetical protein
LRGAIAAADKKPAEAVARQDEAAALWKQADGCRKWRAPWPKPGAKRRRPTNLAGAADRFYGRRGASGRRDSSRRPFVLLEEGVSVAERLDDEAIAKKWRICL